MYLQLMDMHRLGTLEDFGAHFKTSQNVNLWLAYLIKKEEYEREKYKQMMGGDK